MDAKASGASQLGVLHDKLVAVLNYQTSDLLTEPEKAAIELAAALSETRPADNEVLFRKVQRHYGNKQMVTLALSIALENFRSRFNRCFGVSALGRYSKLEELLEMANINVRVTD